MEKLLERNEVEQKDKWDLESVYKSNKELKITINTIICYWLHINTI